MIREELRKKAGQMVFVGFRGTHVDEHSPIVRSLRQGSVGGLWLVDNDTPMGHSIGNIQSASQIRTLTRDLQRHAKIPLFLSLDAEGGEIIRLKPKFGFPAFPSAEDLGRRNDLELTRKTSRALGMLLKDLGFNFNFAPVVDLNKNPSNPAIGRKGRSFSAHPGIVAEHAAVFVQEHRALGIRTVLKHFPGHGSALGDTHQGFVDITPTWDEQELLPYQTLIERGLCDSVMTAHVTHRLLDPEHPATLSSTILRGTLRLKLRFDGLVFVDDLNMKAISEHYPFEEAVRLAITAGADVVLQGNVMNYRADAAEFAHETILKLVTDGAIPEERIDESYRRIMKLKHGIERGRSAAVDR
jgi:beta-N-acetylhexosaminidase